MATHTLPVSEYIKQGVFILVILGVALFGIKSCRKYQKKRAVVIELTSLASESSAYEQFYAKDAKSTLIKAMHQMHLASELGHTPTEILKEVMEVSDSFMDTTEDDDKLSKREKLIRDSLLNNYENCKKLEIFSDPTNLPIMENGDLPVIKSGPSANEQAIITMIIPSSVLEGVDKLIPNLVISPPLSEEEKVKAGDLTEFEITRAKQFAKSLMGTSLIERDAYENILEYYERASSAIREPAKP